MYDIRHPEMVKVGRSSVNKYSDVGEPEDPYEHMEVVGLLLIERIEPIDAPARPEAIETESHTP
jgi:hypothetical protein